MIKDIIRFNSLYDFYGELLTENQKRSFVFYYRLDYSLSEISNEIGISKQGVSENLKRAIKELDRFEDILKMRCKSNRIKQKIGIIKKKLDNNTGNRSEILILLDEIVEELDD